MTRTHQPLGRSNDSIGTPNLIALNSSLTTFPVLGALGLMLGIVLRSAKIDWPFVLIASALLIALSLQSVQRLRLTVMLAALLIPLGWARLALVEAAPDALVAMDGQTVTLEGEFDGHFFESDQGRVLMDFRITGPARSPKLAWAIWS